MRLALMIGLLLAVGCGSGPAPTHAQTEHPTGATIIPSPSQSLAPPTATAAIAAKTTEATTPTPKPDAGVLDLPMGQILVLNQMTNWGSTIYFTELDRHLVSAADLASGNVSVLADTGHWIPWAVAADDLGVVWGAWDPGSDHTADWSVFFLSSATGVIASVDQGHVLRRGDLWDIAMPVDLDGNEVAYAIGAPTQSNPYASRVIIRDLSSGNVVRSVETPLLVSSVALSGDVVAWTGKTYTGNPQAYKSPLEISGPDGQVSTVVSDGASSSSFDSARLVWLERSDPGIGILASGGDVMMAELPTLSGQQLAGSDSLTRYKPFAGDDHVSWVEADSRKSYLVVSDGDPTNHVRVAESSASFLATIGGGWLAWETYAYLDGGAGSEAFFAMPLEGLGN